MSVRKIVIASLLLISFAGVWAQDIAIDLPAEPIRAIPVATTTDITLADAALHNDYPAFQRLYSRDPRPEFAELNRLWTWAMNDRFGAFYGADTHSRLSSKYAGYAGYIEQYRIVDSNGNVFYPTAETRTFLVSSAMRGAVADVTPPTPVVVPTKARPEPVRAAVVPVVLPAVQEVAAAHAPAPVASAPTVVSLPAAAPALLTVPGSTEPVVAPAIKKAVSMPQRAIPAAVPPAPIERNPRSGGVGRGIFLIIAGLLGAGIVSVMLQSSAEEHQVRP